MKAIIVREFGEPEVMVLEEVPTPVPEAGQVLVRIKAAGVNPVDTYLRTGNHAHAPQLPYTPGKDASGIIEAVGPDVTEFTPGDRVYTANSLTGTYAEYAQCSTAHLGKLPDNVSFEQGAGVFTPYATSYRALIQKAGATAGETLLVHGASGGVGIAAVQWAKHKGLTVFGTAGSQEGKRLVLEQGADRVFDHSAAGYLDEIRDASGGKIDVILEMLANVNLQKDLELVSMFGRVVVIGNRGSLEFTPRAMMTKDATVFGMSLFNTPREQMDQIHAEIFIGLKQGFLQPVIGRSYALADAAPAHHAVIEDKAFGKIVLIP